ncbi:MAG: nitrilase-related carbon-nitrogen hydrolase [Bdellovibrionales bacterium]|jgi:predicted amidohydrolase|nr:nitrilase-related carbon-nitrogen hydrolase [Bdellovibrionales bacterium]
MNVAIVQMTSVNDASVNEEAIRHALKEIEQSSKSTGGSGAIDLVVFPENVWFFRLTDGEALPDFAQATKFHGELQEWVDRTGAAVVLGSVPVRGKSFGSSLESGDGGAGDKPYAAMAIFEPGKPWHVPYAKVHLFDVDVAGHKPVRESDHLAGGRLPRIWEFGGWRFGCAICYDVRFAELFSIYAASEVDALFLPSAFLVPTGRQHWEILVRTRAIESQAYMLAPAQSGEHADQSGKATGVRKTYGRSMLIDPWGRIVAAAHVERSGIEILYGEMSRDEIAKVRAQIPMKDHRRLQPKGIQ